ncbi:TKL protein kinase [Phytophthora nicotianae P10297]|uniref:TKL protein kinase n=2 Tax=Phytophthora nicotianae TaxID=4792 RepID=W2PRE0_PHYN3|nr:TKL protein kinase [Phytophthora nicotianae INRA-310]ETN02575.1 TKL protein kinase [Phytophthora nicotianae INRA-310]ETP35139.1 TKL protein kinase [Phytophthora nicotianae P10297]
MARRRARLAALVAVVLVATLTEVAASDAMQRELTLSFTSEAQAGSELPTNNSFVFDGTSSDIARQLYLRHAAGESIDNCVPNTIPAAVTARLAPLNVSFDNLPGLLQRALLWDSGYVISPENDAVQIWTLGGRSMSNLAISKVEFDTTGCTALNCSQPDDSTYYANNFCTGTQMLTAAKCLMDNFDSDTSSHLAMWSDGGDPDMVPEIRAVMHGWLDASTNDSYLLYAVHTMTVDAEPAYGTCNKGGYGSLVVPCYPMSNTSADIVAVMSAPVATPWVTTWIKQYQPASDTTVNSESDSDGSGFNLWLLGPILLSALIASILIIFAVFRKRRRLRSVYFQRPSPAESDLGSSRKSKPSGPLAAPRQRENRTSLRRTEQQTIGEFNRTLRLPGEDDSPVAEPSPVSEEILPRPRRNTTPASRTAPPTRGVPTNAPTSRRGTVPAPHSSTPRARTHSTHTVSPERAQSSRRTSNVTTRQSSGQRSADERQTTRTSPIRPSSARAPNPIRRPSVQTCTRPSSARSSRRSRSRSETWSDRSSTRNHSAAPRDHLPTLRESASMSPITEFMPSIRDSIQADRESIPALRETFSRYSATDNVQYTLTTDSNLIGKRIAWERIELGRLLSRGAFGEVWACRYAGKKVAVKRLLQTRTHTFLETEKFTNEIQLTASLNHPNIVRFIGVTWSSLENLAMVEEYLPRGDLQNYLKRNGDLMTWARDKIDMAIGIARAIDYLHSRQVIHRDIKARNILLTKRLQPKLIDFGASRLWEPNDMTAGVGTPFWTAPEVLESTEYTEKADIYSFGVLLTELDTCEAPYHNTLGANGEKMKPFHILKEVVDGTLRPSLSCNCPQRISKAADACFQHDPNLRPSASELVRMLEG